MSKIIKFGEDVVGYEIPVLNEREVRASAGILFVFMLTSLLLIMFKGNFLLIKYVATVFLTDMVIRVFVNPKYSPTLIIGRFIVRNQVPEYVGAKQKKFAWTIGIFLASMMFIFMVIVNSYSAITGITCMICLLFLFFESAFGICLGCKFYPLFFKDKVQHCPGEVCEVKSRHEIQKTTLTQWIIVLAFIAFIFATVFLFNDNFSVKPHNLFGTEKSAPTK